MLAIGRYADPVLRRAITQWKYAGDPDAWRPLARLVRAHATHLAPFETFAVSWIPLHADRLRERGFDQAELIAREVAASIGRETKRLLMRKSWTAPQARREGRQVGELDGAFVARGDMPSAVLLCDDVFTSGATMDAAAKELKEAGASLVWGFTLARG
jgi:predicted amidophosphoribosyltransferase